MIKSGQTRGACDTHKGPKNTYRIVGGNQWKRDCLGALGIDERITSKRIFRKQDKMVCTGFIWLKVGTSGGPL